MSEKRGTLPSQNQIKEMHTALANAMEPIKEKRIDLEKDYATRGSPFWNGLLNKELPAVREALKLGIGQMPMTNLSHYIHGANEKIDIISINLTSYIQVCGSWETQHMTQRHHILKLLRTFERMINGIMELLELLEGDGKGE